MALVPLATKGNYFHVYDFRVKAGRGDELSNCSTNSIMGTTTRSTARAPKSRTACCVATLPILIISI